MFTSLTEVLAEDSRRIHFDSLFAWSRHARPGRALSTLDGAHRRHRLFLVGGYHCDVLLFQIAKLGVAEVRICLIPIKAREILLQPGLFEYLAVPGVNLLPHLRSIFYKQSFEQSACDRFRAQLLMHSVLELDDRFYVLLIAARQLLILEILTRLVPKLAVKILL